MLIQIFSKMFLFSILITLAFSCGKGNADDYALENSSQVIVGSWRLIETVISDGTGKTSKVNMESKNYVVTFQSDGNVLSSDFPCNGRYEFDSFKRGRLGDNNLTVTFEKCEASKVEWYSIMGKADAYILDFNTLILNSENCDEGCTRTYRRIKR